MTDGASPPPPPSPPGSGTPAAGRPSAPNPSAASQAPQGQAGQPPPNQSQANQASQNQTPPNQTSPNQTAQAQTAPASSNAQAQQPLPPDLARAQPGTTVEAEAVSRNSDGSVTIRTAQGDIRADLARAQVAELLRAGTRVTVELRNPSANPPQLVVTVRGGTALQPAVSTGASAPAPTVPLMVGRILQAVAVPGVASGAPATGAPAQGGAAAAQAAPPVPGAAPATGNPAPAPAASRSAGQAPTAQAAVPQGTPQQAPAGGTGGPAPAPTASAPGTPTPTATNPAASTPAPPTPATGQATPQQIPTPSALAVQSAYRNALGLTGRAPQAPPLPNVGTAPAVAAGQTASAPPATGQAAGGGLAAATAPSPGAGPQLPVGAVVTVRVLATGEEVARFVGARQTTAPVPGAAGQGQIPGASVLAGTVTGVTQSGRPVVATPFGHLAINATSDLRIGDRIALDVLASRVGDTPTAERPAPLSVLAREWPALDGAVRALQEALGPQAAAQITQAMVRPSPQMTAAMMFFMAALKAGDMRSWFGNDASRALENAGRGGLLSTLAEDFQTLQRAAEPSESGWRAFLIPLVGDEKRPIRVLTRGRRGRKGGKDGGNADGTSFLVDLELSRLGPFRLDGLVRDDLVDLWIRTTKPLPPMIRHDIKALFDGALDRTGIQGRLAFKATPVLPPLPVADLQAGAAGDTESLFA